MRVPDPSFALLPDQVRARAAQARHLLTADEEGPSSTVATMTATAAELYEQASTLRSEARQLQIAAEDQLLTEFNNGRQARHLARDIGTTESRIWQMLRQARRRAGLQPSRPGRRTATADN